MKTLEDEFNQILNNIRTTHEEIDKLKVRRDDFLNQRKKFVTDIYKYTFKTYNMRESDLVKYTLRFQEIHNNKIGSSSFWFDNDYYTNDILEVFKMFLDIAGFRILFLNISNKNIKIRLGIDDNCANILFYEDIITIPKSIPMELFYKLLDSEDCYKIFNLLVSDEFELGLILLNNL
jgi:hypothetical protein